MAPPVEPCLHALELSLHAERLNDSVFSIIAGYAVEYRGVVEYYRMAYNLRQLGHLRWTMETSMAKTLAAKLRISVPKVYRRFGAHGGVRPAALARHLQWALRGRRLRFLRGGGPRRWQGVQTGWDRGDHGFTDDASTVAYDAATGAPLWVARYDGPMHRGDAAYSLALSPDGQTVFIAGESYSRSGVDHALTVAFNAATGAQLWADNSRLFAESEYSNATSVAVAPDCSRVHITGATATARTTGCLYPNDYVTVAFDAATGTRLWASRYDGPAHCYDYTQSIGVSPDGRAVYVTGTSKGEGQDYGTVAYEATTGEQIQLARYDGPAGWDAATALAVGPDGSLYVTGESASRNYRDYGTIRYAPE